MTPWREEIFWPHFQSAGFLTKALVALPGCPEATEAWVEYVRPDELVGGGAGISAEHAIEYQHADLPTLAEGTQLLLEHRQDDPTSRVKYRVRAPPEVENDGTGFFRVAVLTREAC